MCMWGGEVIFGPLRKPMCLPETHMGFQKQHPPWTVSDQENGNSGWLKPFLYIHNGSDLNWASKVQELRRTCRPGTPDPMCELPNMLIEVQFLHKLCHSRPAYTFIYTHVICKLCGTSSVFQSPLHLTIRQSRHPVMCTGPFCLRRYPEVKQYALILRVQSSYNLPVFDDGVGTCIPVQTWGE